MAKFYFDGQALTDLELLTVALQRAVPVGQCLESGSPWVGGTPRLSRTHGTRVPTARGGRRGPRPAELLPAPEHPASVGRGRPTERQQDAEVRGGSLHRALEMRRYLIPPRTAPLPFPQWPCSRACCNLRGGPPSGASAGARSPSSADGESR